MIDKLIPQIDKLKHFYLWTLAFLVCAIVLTMITDLNTSLIIAYSLTIITAGGKEVVWDWMLKKGNPELMDFWYSILAPSLIMILLYICLY